MRSLSPRDYRLLPRLESPAGYICVIRDIDSDRYRIDRTNHPGAYMDALLGEMTGSYGIELLSILETDDIAASEIRLNEHHHATLSDTWLELDAYQLRALRKSELRILDYSSYYISQGGRSLAEAARSASNMAGPREWSGAAHAHGEAPTTRSPIREYYRVNERRPSQLKEPEPESWRQMLSDKFDDFMHNHPGLAIAIILLVMLLSLIHFWGRPYPY
ncbi:MAG: hypothetical protein OXG49_11990 [Chloroflexi bacterium]|nr:hypothetical protein [Chloroflexota bacterium]